MSRFIEFLEAHPEKIDGDIAALFQNNNTFLEIGLKESGLDSLQYFELIMQIEEHFDIALSEEATAKASTFKELEALIDSAIEECHKKSS